MQTLSRREALRGATAAVAAAHAELFQNLGKTFPKALWQFPKTMGNFPRTLGKGLWLDREVFHHFGEDFPRGPVAVWGRV